MYGSVTNSNLHNSSAAYEWMTISVRVCYRLPVMCVFPEHVSVFTVNSKMGLPLIKTWRKINESLVCIYFE